MSKHGKRDILIHFDEESNELILYTVAVDDTRDVRAKEFDGARLDIPSLLAVSADDAEMALGSTILSLVDVFSFKKTGIRPYDALNEERHRQDIEDWKHAAAEGDAEAQYLLFIDYHHQALLGPDAIALRSAEEMLEAAATQGYKAAIKARASWPLMKAAVVRKIEGLPPT